MHVLRIDVPAPHWAVVTASPADLPARVFGTVQLPGDESDHPFGQWSAVLERTGVEGAPLFRLVVPSDDAPIAALVRGTNLQFFRAPRRVASLTVIAGPAAEPVDSDTRLLPCSPPRAA